MTTNGTQGLYANEGLTSSVSLNETEIASDPASSGFFSTDYKKHEDLKQMLDGNKDALKLEAMKRIIGMVAKGKDASELFPAVVKNVVSKNIEVKKLVYVYLVRYAEEQQDLALLSISTFQRALKDPNQLIRASALRVLSSIRVPMIVPIMMLAIKEGVMDMSPYVRKTAAHAIPKLFSLDPEQKDILIEVIEKLLADKTTLVAGSAIQAFEEVCPERIDLIHKNYRKFCNLLVDVEEWGQVVIINMLTRYCRTQFLDPNMNNTIFADENDEKHFYESENSQDEEKDEVVVEKKKTYVMDTDHRLLLRNCKPLLNSRNAATVMAVAQLYYHCAPSSEVGLVAKALIRLLRGHREVQYIVLSNIASMSVKQRGMFEPYLKSFYVRSNDQTQTKVLKLEILTNLATESNISIILREFQTYVTSSDKEFAAATIQAIGRCASSISEITDACLNGLVSLLSNKDEVVVGESVVVIKKLLQMRPQEHKEMIIHLAKLADSINVAMARASILWLIGEYSDRVPKIAPDVLRKMAKSFIEEEDIVKLQILNLAAKMCITNSKQTKLLCQYVFNLAKYDQNYDIRDRARFLRQLILPGENSSSLSKYARKIFLATKPAPVLESKFKDRENFQLGTLSHIINARASGYQELEEWPTVAPDTSVRNVETWDASKSVKSVSKEKKKKSFYSSSESSKGSSDSGTTSGADTPEMSENSETESDSEQSEDESDESSPEISESDSDEDLDKANIPISVDHKDNFGDDEDPSAKASSSSSYSDESDDPEISESSSSSEEETQTKKKVTVVKSKPEKNKISKVEKGTKAKSEQSKNQYSDLPNLLDLDFDTAITSPSFTPNDVMLMTPVAASMSVLESTAPSKPSYIMVNPANIPSNNYELLNRITGRGLGIMYRFTRTVSIFAPKMTAIELIFTNHSSENVIKDIHLQKKKSHVNIEIKDFPSIELLAPNQSITSVIEIDFNDTTQPAELEVVTHESAFNVSLTAPVGELLQHNTITENDFLSLKGKLTGMNEAVGSVTLETVDLSAEIICKAIYKVANVLQVSSTTENLYQFASKLVSSRLDTLITLDILTSSIKIFVNCEKMVIGSMLVKDIKTSLSNI